ncbi:hypothetical protein [Pedobacter punctiformis]|uniref:HEAT repeat domain-containing protein n=1 Tax=Pedobacter punctiformis TaxID=3004097 RepID=A0ABT4LA94_9SPHI|nr:hypothetical protein [Pedobacter sp. HCMS5-2]MCZ4244846.1 hypothetical protein [Pedobacter sp. HCMS5-2]
MTIEELFKDKSVKAKAKVAQIGEWLLENTLPSDELLAFAETQNATNRATCIEAIEYATKKNPNLADETVFFFVTKALKEDEPRIKWESAKVIANISSKYSDKLDSATTNLLENAVHNGTVVRWATALALGEILKLKTSRNIKLMPVLEKLSEAEEDNGVKKKYLDAIKKAKK